MNENRQERKEKWRARIHAWYALAWNRPVRKWIASALIINLVIEICNQRTPIWLLSYVFGNPLVFLYNTMLIMVPLSLAFVFRKRDFVHALMSSVCLLLGITNGIVLSCRVTPFNATDFRNVDLPDAFEPVRSIDLSASKVAGTGCSISG